MSRLQRLQRLWLRRLRRLRRLLSVLVVRRLPAGLMPWKGMIEAWLEARRVKRRFQGGNLRKRDRLPLAFIDLADHVWLCNTADLDRA